ncbi:MAG: DUF4178 domain-containing protein [Polyangia bacterium]
MSASAPPPAGAPSSSAGAPGPTAKLARCPECGADVRFSTPGSLLSVCTYCRSVVAKKGTDYEKLGKVAELAEVPSPLFLGLRGKAWGGFAVVGRLQLDHGAGTWNEWYLALDNGRWLWLAEAQGRYYLTASIGAVKGVPAFDKIHLGRTVRMRRPEGQSGEPLDMHAVEIHAAKLVSVEGELPFRIQPGQPTRYVDLSGPRSTFGTLDYGAPGSREDPVGFVGNQVRIEELQLDFSSFERPPPKATVKAARMSCPSCQGALELKAPDFAMRVTCPYCRALVDVTKEPLRALGQLKKQDITPLFPLGATATLRGKKYTVLGFQRRKIIKGGEGGWDEYVLWTGEPSDSAFHYLSESGGHFTLIEPIGAGDVRGGDMLRYYKDDVYKIAEDCTTEVTYVSGEFPWEVRQGEKTRSRDYTPESHDGRVLSEESAVEKQELNFSHGVYLEPGEVWRAFNLSGTPPKQSWVATNQPNPYAERLKRQKFIFYWASMAWIILTTWACVRGDSTVRYFRYSSVAGVEPSAEHVIFTDPFPIGTSGQQAVEVELSSEVENSWMATDVSLVNEETGETFAAGLEVAYYHGVDGGESWSEGSRTKSLVIPQVPAGKYVLRIEPSWPVVPSCTTSIDCGPISYLATRTWTCNLGKCERSCSEYASDCGTGRSCLNGRCVIPAVPYKIKLAYPSARTGYAFWLWLFMAAVPLWSFFGFRSFEKRRADDNS